MRIKINDKIYRLKEIESGVDSLMELVEEPMFKEGDFIKNVCSGAICIYYGTIDNGGMVSHVGYNNGYTTTKTGTGWGYTKDFRHATEEEKQILLDALAKEGKMWNAEKLCVEDIPIRRFKKGDKVRIKEGVSSETHGCVYPYFTDFLSRYMDKVMTVEEYITTDIGEYVTTYEAKRGDHPFGFSEDWLEPYEGPKEGDFVAGLGCIFILHKRIDGNSAQFYVLYAKTNGKLLYHKTYFNLGGIDKLGLATESEKQELIDVLAKEGKMWNAEKRCVENIPKRKFKKGDKVRIKDGVSSETHYGVRPGFARKMDDLIGKTMTIDGCADDYYIVFEEIYWAFPEEWLEPYEELKKGDLAIFWDSDSSEARIGVYNKFYDCLPFPYIDHIGNSFRNAVKFESTEQFEKLINGEI